MALKSSVLAKFEANNPRAAVLLSLVDFSREVFCRTDIGEENLKDLTQDSPELVHRQSGAFSEAKDWAASYEVCKVDLLVDFWLVGCHVGNHCSHKVLPILVRRKTCSMGTTFSLQATTNWVELQLTLSISALQRAP